MIKRIIQIENNEIVMTKMFDDVDEFFKFHSAH